MRKLAVFFVALILFLLSSPFLNSPVVLGENYEPSKNIMSEGSSYAHQNEHSSSNRIANTTIPNPISEALVALGITIENFDSNFSCASALIGTFERFDTCTMQPNSSSEGCAREAARFIASPLCESVCSSNCNS